MEEYNGNSGITVVTRDCYSIILLQLSVSNSAEINGPTHAHACTFAIRICRAIERNWVMELIWNTN